MTAQISDTIKFDGKDYNIAGVKGNGLFNPHEHGLSVEMISTACWRGYYCSYKVNNEELYLQDVSVGLDEDNKRLLAKKSGPYLFGKLPKHNKEAWCYDFLDLNWKVPFNGGILAGLGFVRELYVHMGFHPAWKYRSVVELIFEEGVLLETLDRSTEMASIRERTTKDDLKPSSMNKEEVMNWIRDCFSLEYE
ncbi:MAG: hypothetical protein AB1489_36330 [Acidobacteriota bacterium]